MRDLVLREGLRTMARDAAKRLRELVAAGHDIPYEVREAKPGSPFSQYQPLTERFLREQAPALDQLDSFGAACAALESSGLAGPYLEAAGVAVPSDPRRRAELAGIAFLCRLWADSTDFSLDRERLDAAIAEVEAGGDATPGEIEVAVPLRGLQLPIERLDLATATIVRADTVEVPPDARLAEGSGAAWEPAFLAVTRVGEGDEDAPDAGSRAVDDFRLLITTLRLFRAGGVGLGPHAWTRVGGDRWRRISTGAGRPRPGGYRLAEAELAELAGFSRALAGRRGLLGRAAMGRPGFAGALARAISRFEAGLERVIVLEALNDYLLALRFLLEGGGPARLDLSIRVAGLCAEPERRDEVRSIVERASALERELWSGEPVSIADGPTPARTAAELEDLARAILRDAACGHLGTDLRVAADEILLADGLAVGEGAADQRGATAEWEMGEEADASEHEWDESPVDELGAAAQEARTDELIAAQPGSEWGDAALVADDGQASDTGDPDQPASGRELWLEAQLEWAGPTQEPESRAGIVEPPLQVPEPARRITVEQRTPDLEEDRVIVEAGLNSADQGAVAPAHRASNRADTPAADAAGARATRRSASDRVAYLFPAPEATDWTVREISYDRSRRAPVKAS